MDDFLNLREAAAFSGRSESTLKRLIARVLEEHKHDQRLIDQIIKKREAAKGYFWFISKQFLSKEFALGEPMNDQGQPSEQPRAHNGEPVNDHVVGQRTLESEIIAILKEQLRVKDEQIRNFQERDKEYNILLKTFQDKLFLLEAGRIQDEPEAYQEQASGGGEEGMESAEADPFAAAPSWPGEDVTAHEEQPAPVQEPEPEPPMSPGWNEESVAPEDAVWPEAEVPVTVEALATAEQPVAVPEGAPAGEQAADAVPAGGNGQAEPLPKTLVIPYTAPAQQEGETSVPGAVAADPAAREAEPPAPVMAAAAPVSAAQEAGEGSAAASAPPKKKGFWRRVFGG